MEYGWALALVLSLVAAQGGRAQQIVAQLSARLGRAAGVLLAAAGASALAAGAMAVLGASLHASLPAGAHAPLACAALLAAAVALVLPLRGRPLREPTRSLGAIILALVMRQSADPPRLAVLAITIIGAAPWPVGMGAALGCGAALGIGWVLGERLASWRQLQAIRLIAGISLAVIAGWIGWAASADLPSQLPG